MGADWGQKPRRFTNDLVEAAFQPILMQGEIGCMVRLRHDGFCQLLSFEQPEVVYYGLLVKFDRGSAAAPRATRKTAGSPGLR